MVASGATVNAVVCVIGGGEQGRFGKPRPVKLMFAVTWYTPAARGPTWNCDATRGSLGNVQAIVTFCWITNVVPTCTIEADVTYASAPKWFSTRIVTVSVDVGEGGVTMTAPDAAEDEDSARSRTAVFGFMKHRVLIDTE